MDDINNPLTPASRPILILNPGYMATITITRKGARRSRDMNIFQEYQLNDLKKTSYSTTGFLRRKRDSATTRLREITIGLTRLERFIEKEGQRTPQVAAFAPVLLQIKQSIEQLTACTPGLENLFNFMINDVEEKLKVEEERKRLGIAKPNEEPQRNLRQD